MRVMREESELFSYIMEKFSPLLIKAMDQDMWFSRLLSLTKLVLSIAAKNKSNHQFVLLMIGSQDSWQDT